ncbi:MAG: hypothetical protein WCO06_04360 [Candidatus Roizmanbacteria bacterium]
MTELLNTDHRDLVSLAHDLYRTNLNYTRIISHPNGLSALIESPRNTLYDSLALYNTLVRMGLTTTVADNGLFAVVIPDKPSFDSLQQLGNGMELNYYFGLPFDYDISTLNAPNDIIINNQTIDLGSPHLIAAVRNRFRENPLATTGAYMLPNERTNRSTRSFSTKQVWYEIEDSPPSQIFESPTSNDHPSLFHQDEIDPDSLNEDDGLRPILIDPENYVLWKTDIVGSTQIAVNSGVKEHTTIRSIALAAHLTALELVKKIVGNSQDINNLLVFRLFAEEMIIAIRKGNRDLELFKNLNIIINNIYNRISNEISHNVQFISVVKEPKIGAAMYMHRGVAFFEDNLPSAREWKTSEIQQAMLNNREYGRLLDPTGLYYT